MTDYRLGLKKLPDIGNVSFGLKSKFGLKKLPGVSVAPTIYDILLSWTDNSDNEDGFKIEHSPNGSEWTQIAVVESNVTSYLVTKETDGVDSSIQNYFRVRAYSGDGYSDYSNIANVQCSGG